MKVMTYQQTEEYILNIPKFRKEVNIQQTKKFYEFLGKPGVSSSIIHVAGTNGKGSTCAYMNAVLSEAKYKVGMFTSPHLVSIRERMRVNHEMISKQVFVELCIKLIESIEGYNQCLKNSFNKSVKYYPTFYEFLFFMSMLYFEEQNAEIIILETGIGGRLDATNVIDAPKVVVITDVGLDHMEYLGDTYGLIAQEKAGIIKKGSRVVYSANRQEVIEVIERKAAECDILCKSVEKCEKHSFRFVDKKIDFSFQSRYYGYIPITLSTCALYQVDNARLALHALEELDLEIPLKAIKDGMTKCKWEGRMEEILPGVFLDGAHNEDGINAFITSVEQDKCPGERWLLFSAVADKEYENMKEVLIDSGLFKNIYAAPLRNARGITKERLEKIFSESSIEKGIINKNFTEHKTEYIFHDYKVKIVDRSYEGLEEILSLKKEEDYVYVTGSLYLVSEIKKEEIQKKKI